LIAVERLDFRYPDGGFRLRVPELRAARGETVAVIGVSGSGKSTLLHLLAGISRPAAGTVIVDDVPITQLGDRARREFRLQRLGLVFQEFELLYYLDVLDNILLPCRLSGATKLGEPTRERAVRLAEEVGLSWKTGRNVQRLSQGERQRVALCRALLLEPAVLLTDEPTANLDPANTDAVLDLLFELVRRAGTTLVAATHDRDVLDRFDRVVDMKDLHAHA